MEDVYSVISEEASIRFLSVKQQVPLVPVRMTERACLEDLKTKVYQYWESGV